MMTITPAQMKELETRFMAEYNVPGALLMEHAALGVVDAIARYTDKGTVVFLCGPGNNGGDGYAAARLWANRGGTSNIIEITDQLTGDARLNRTLAEDTPRVYIYSAADERSYRSEDVIVDAIFGTGLSRAPEGLAARMIHYATDSFERGTPVIAVDIPSGIDGTTGEVLGYEAIRATETVTFHRVKQGLLLGNAPEYVGKLTLQPIIMDEDYPIDEPVDGMQILTPADLTGDIFRRHVTCHKGDFGRVVLFCGSKGMAGAAALCANAAMRAGAGLTTILCRESLLPILQTLAPSAMCAVLPEQNGLLLPEAAAIAQRELARADAACIGCGLGQTSDVMPILRLFAKAACPVVWDADALNLLAKHDGLLPLKETDVITPHPGEASRLLDCDAEEVTADALSALDRLHDLCGCIVLLKAARTLITDGMESFANLYTSPALAKGGSGDVLAGIITALLARNDKGYFPFVDGVNAVAHAALIHGLAGVRAAKQHGENCTLPTDVVDCIRLDAEGLD